MEPIKGKIISVETIVKAPIDKTWSFWTEPKHITKWCFASDDWHSPSAENDLHVKGKFRTRMAAKDGTAAFDFEGIYTRIEKYKAIEYTIADGRKVKISFSDLGVKTRVVESFEPEQENPPEMQKGGWQAILENFRKYSESKNNQS
jgi:uncharacterized protein YndB with AHSA1/START domain